MSVSATALSDAAPPPAPPPDRPVNTRLPDFSERISPMLVKELRQGMRSPVFVWGLIVMNLFLAAVVYLTMEDPEESSLHQAFFGAYCLLVCVLLPLRASTALHEEMRGNTLDTLVLTDLNGWRITTGKWIAVVAQQILAALTVLPYLVVRYFAGGISLPLELAWLGIFLLTGMSAAAVLTGFSWIQYFLFRSAVMMAVIFGVASFCYTVVEDMFDYRREYFLDGMHERLGWMIFPVLAAPAVHLSLFALDVGAARISPLVQSSAVRRRLAGLGFLLLYAGAALWAVWTSPPTLFGRGMVLGVSAFLALCTFLVIAVQAMLEPVVNYTATLMPWVRHGRAGRLAGRFLYPGWPSGTLFTAALLLAGISAALGAFWVDAHGRGRWTGEVRMLAQSVAGVVPLLGMPVVPLVLWRLFLSRRLNWAAGPYIILMGVAGGVQLVIAAVAGAAGKLDLLKWGLPVPTMAWSWLGEAQGVHDRYEPPELLIDYFPWGYVRIVCTAVWVSMVWWLLAIWVALRAFRVTRSVEREAEALLKAGAATAQEPETEKPLPVSAGKAGPEAVS